MCIFTNVSFTHCSGIPLETYYCYAVTLGRMPYFSRYAVFAVVSNCVFQVFFKRTKRIISRTRPDIAVAAKCGNFNFVCALLCKYVYCCYKIESFIAETTRVRFFPILGKTQQQKNCLIQTISFVKILKKNIYFFFFRIFQLYTGCFFFTKTRV